MPDGVLTSPSYPVCQTIQYGLTSNSVSIIIENQIISKYYTLENFQRNFDYDEENTYFQDRKKNLVCQDDSRMYYTYISIPICNGAGGECLVFCFNKKGNIDNVQFYTITHLNIQ